jgi:heme/copper-type cytochrome/quinol oxidase subunit 2
MSPFAFWMMIGANFTVAGLAVYFLWRVLKAKKRPEPDSYSENDED